MKRKHFLVEIANFLWARKAYWIVPVIFFLLMMILLIIIGTSPVVGFVYTVF